MSIQFSPVPRYSSHGRPRRVTNAMITDILAWHAQRMTAKEKADSLGVSETTLHNVIRSAGTHYKQPSPEQRPATIARGREIRQQLREAHLI